MATSEPLRERTAFVTGAARGIGRAIALALAEAGAAVAVADLKLEPFRGERWYRLRERVSDPEEEKTSTADAVRALGREAVEIELDVGDAAAVDAAAKRAASELGPIDVLVNAAGIVNNIAPIAGMSVDEWEHELRVNLSGAFHTVKVMVPAMAERGWGRVINIASVAARTPALGQPAYAASKAGLVTFTRATAQEFGPRGVTANAVLPGLIATPLVRSMPAKIRDGVVRGTPLGRVGTPEEVAALVAFLATPAAGFITATAIPCDGGMLGAPVALAGLND